MRGVLGLAAGLVAVMATTGVAIASENRNAPAAAPPSTVAARPDPVDTIGTVEQIGQLLDYAGAERTKTFHYPGASYMKVHFNRMLLLPGDYVTVSKPDGTDSQVYSGDPGRAVTEAANSGRWAMSVDGDTAVVTMHTKGLDPGGLRGRLAEMGVSVDRYARGYTKAERDAKEVAARKAKADEARRSGTEESVCGHDDKQDATCYKSSDPVPYTRSKAVARLLINGVELCSAWRVGPNNRMFTNHHCFTDSYDARNTEVWFNYECAVCGGWDTLETTKVWGDRVLATDDTLDYTLFTVQNFDTIARFGYLQLDVRAPRKGEELYIPQHPAGDPTKIAMDSPFERNGNCSVADPSYYGYDAGTDLSYYCDTEGGSSGSPVLSRATNRVIGLHHFGGCPNSGVRIDLVYDRVGSLL